MRLGTVDVMTSINESISALRDLVEQQQKAIEKLQASLADSQARATSLWTENADLRKKQAELLKERDGLRFLVYLEKTDEEAAGKGPPDAA